MSTAKRFVDLDTVREIVGRHLRFGAANEEIASDRILRQIEARALPLAELSKVADLPPWKVSPTVELCPRCMTIKSPDDPCPNCPRAA